jgi:N-acetylmuramoyl-L-alanine amidase
MKLVTREEWGANHPTSVTKLSPSAIDAMVVHYTASDADEQSDHANCAKRVKGIQIYHMTPGGHDPSMPWSDIAYNFLFCKHGYIFEGRGWNVRSAATGAANSHTQAICFLGDDSVARDDVTDAGRAALVDFAQAYEKRYNNTNFKGHKDYMSTGCPGNDLYIFVHSAKFKKMVKDQSAPDLAYWRWLAWTLGEGDWKGKKPYSKPRPGSKVFPERIPKSWQARRLAYLAKRKK